MLNIRILDFFNSLRDEIKEMVKSKSSTSSNYAFKEVFLSYLLDTGDVNLMDCTLLDFKKDADGIRLDGYALNEQLQTLTLLISCFETKSAPSVIKKTELEKLLKKALKFYKLCNSDYFDDLEESSDGYQAFDFIKTNSSNIEEVHIVLITNNEVIPFIPEDSKVGKIGVTYDVWDIERLYNTVFPEGENSVDNLVIKLKERYNSPLKLIRVPCPNEIYDCYIGVISGTLLARIYDDEGQNLIQKNVRSYLTAKVKVNRGIRNTLSREPEMFMAYNNGISTIADSVTLDDTSTDDICYINEIKGWQIVNGGQTTASIHYARQRKYQIDDVNVQIKLTVIKNRDKADGIIRDISLYANSQNKINLSDFNANDPYHIKMEQISRNTFIPVEKGKGTKLWFYERARGQYLVELSRQPTQSAKNTFKENCPQSRCLSKTVAAKCVMTWNGFPQFVSKGLETSFVKFSSMVEANEVPEPSIEEYKNMIAKVILFNSCDKIIERRNFGGFKAQQDYYTMALLGTYHQSSISLSDIWNNQSIDVNTVSLIDDIATFVWGCFQNPTVSGVNISQWCKKDECWTTIRKRYEEYLQHKE